MVSRDIQYRQRVIDLIVATIAFNMSTRRLSNWENTSQITI